MPRLPWSVEFGRSRTARCITKSSTARPVVAGSRWGLCNVRSFIQHARQIEVEADYAHLDGAEQFDTFLVLSTGGQAVATVQPEAGRILPEAGVTPGRYRTAFCSSPTRPPRSTLADLYLGKFSQFFLAVKNDACVCCGRGDRLSRHHVVPKRHRRKVPMPWRNCLSNVLFVCLDCHEKYEQTPEPDLDVGDWREYVYAWKEHFIRVMQPKFLPAGWDIVSVTNLEAVARGRAVISRQPGKEIAMKKSLLAPVVILSLWSSSMESSVESDSKKATRSTVADPLPKGWRIEEIAKAAHPSAVPRTRTS